MQAEKLEGTSEDEFSRDHLVDRRSFKFGGIEVGIEPTPVPDDQVYINEEYGFGFTFPGTWSLEKIDHGVVLEKATYRLAIHFRREDEDVPHYFGRTGFGAGNLIDTGKINFFGRVFPNKEDGQVAGKFISVNKLLYEGKAKAVIYGEYSLIEVNELLFMIILEDLETDYIALDIPEEIIAEANSIVESFQLIPKNEILAADPAKAADVLTQFFAYLSSAQYDEAVSLYGGSYKVLRGNNPDVDPEDHAALFRKACEINGFVCLPVHVVDRVENMSSDELIVFASFSTRNGEVFERSSCCGATEEEMPPQSIFEFRVRKYGSGEYKVLDLPVYLP
jgi:hypothetical protein